MNPIIRIFVSSTFSDFTEERELLNKQVFPQLEAHCQSQGFTFQAVDLRWGISSSAAIAQDTIDVCLQEVERCQQLSPFPNFFLMLGNRYGWQPLPSPIPQEEYGLYQAALESLPPDWAGHVPSALFAQWYVLDENPVPPTYVLKPRYPGDGWDIESEVLRKALQHVMDTAPLSPQSKEKYYLSATGLEIMIGALDLPKEQENSVVCFFRHIDAIDAHVDVDGEKHHWLRVLKQRLEHKFSEFSYRVPLGKQGRQEDYLQAFATATYDQLKEVIDQRIATQQQVTPAQQEAQLHQDFCAERTQDFVGRTETLSQAMAYLDSPEGRVLVVSGVRGVGKSAFTAKLSQLAQAVHPHVIARFVGASGNSSDSFGLLQELNNACRTAFNLAPVTSGNYPSAIAAFMTTLDSATATQPLVILVDAIDQLTLTTSESPLQWLPKRLPPHVALVVVTREAPYLQEATQRLHQPQILTLPPLDEREIKDILSHWLTLSQRTLQPSQWAELLSHCQQTPLPLYLRLAFHQAKALPSFRPLCLGDTMEDMVVAYLEDLASEPRHGAQLTASALAYIALGYQGASEQEVVDLLGNNPGVLAELKHRSPNSPPIQGIPFMVWARFFADIAPYVKEISSDDTLLFAYYHMQIDQAVRSHYLSPTLTNQVHRDFLALYLSQPLFFDDQGNHPNRRALSAMAYHYMAVDDRQGLWDLLMQQPYLQAKYKTGQLKQVVDELSWVLEAIDPATGGQAVDSFLHFTINHNIHNANTPISWEDLHNLMIFKRNRTLHSLFFAQLSEEDTLTGHAPTATPAQRQYIRTQALARRINHCRRRGELTQAQELISTLLQEVDDPREQSRILYDQAYVHFLQGDFQAVAPVMARSAALSAQAGSEVGQYISLLVGQNIHTVETLFTPEQPKALAEHSRLLDETYAVMKRNAQTDGNANRFLSNVWEHRGLVAYYSQDLSAMRTAWQEFKDTPFVRAWDDGGNFQLFSARLAGLEGRLEEAIAMLENHVAYKCTTLEPSQIESLAQLYWMLGDWHSALGHTDKATASWQQGLDLPPAPGNHTWQREIRRRMGLKNSEG